MRDLCLRRNIFAPSKSRSHLSSQMLLEVVLISPNATVARFYELLYQTDLRVCDI